MTLGTAIALGLLVAVIIFLFKGFKTIAVGAVGIEIKMGQRTGGMLKEGTVWLLPGVSRLEQIYFRERQIDIPPADYPTADRARIRFKTTLRVQVTDPIALFDQGPGTYRPFQVEEGRAEESNTTLRKPLENMIREEVSTMLMQEVMFGGSGTSELRQRIRRAVDATTSRWGVHIVEVFLTGVEAPDLDVSMQKELKAELEGLGDLKAHEAEIAKGGLHFKVGVDIANRLEQLGHAAPLDQILKFLTSHYQNERALEIAKIAAGKNNPYDEYYTQFVGPAAMGIQGPEIGRPKKRLGGPNHGPADLFGSASRCPSCGSTNPKSARFCDQCATQLSTAGRPGNPGPTQIEGASTVRQGALLIGRDPAVANVVLNSEGVSRQHCRLEEANGQWLLSDLNSANGTFLHGQRLVPHTPTAVSRQDQIGLGTHLQISVSDLLARR